MVWYFLVVANVNLGAGFSLAMYASWRSRAMVRAAAALRNPPGAEDENIGQGKEGFDSLGKASEETPAVQSPAVQSPAVQSPAADSEPPRPEESEAEAADTASEAEAPALPSATKEAIAALLDDVEAGLSGTSEAGPSLAEAAVKELKDQVRQFHDKLSEHDSQLRDEATPRSPKKVEPCLKAFRQTNADHLATLQQAKSNLERAGCEKEELRNLLDNLIASVEKQTERIKEANEASQQFDYEGNLADECRQMVDVTMKLLSAGHQFRDTVDETAAELARSEDRLGSADSLARVDALTGVIDRLGLEAHLRQLWENDPHRQRPLAVGILDLDNFGKVNEQFGQARGDRILRAFAQMLESKSGHESKVARMAGQRFALVIPDADLRSAVAEMERLRQTAEAMKYKMGDEEIQVTVSCAVMEVGENDTSDSLFARCDATVQEAKRFGRNRTFSHEGEYPTAVVPSNLTPLEQLISV